MYLLAERFHIFDGTLASFARDPPFNLPQLEHRKRTSIVRMQLWPPLVLKLGRDMWAPTGHTGIEVRGLQGMMEQCTRAIATDLTSKRPPLR